MIIDEQNLDWLLEESEPSIRYRALTELVDFSENEERVSRTRDLIASSAPVELLFSAMEPDGSWQYQYPHKINGYFKYLSATLSYASELGLDARDERVARAAEHLFSMQKADGDFYRHYSCYNGLLLRSLNRLGFGSDERTCLLRRLVLESIRQDGGYHCDLRPRRGRNAPTAHKSCIKGSLKTLLAFSEVPELSQTDVCMRLVEVLPQAPPAVSDKCTRRARNPEPQVVVPDHISSRVGGALVRIVAAGVWATTGVGRCVGDSPKQDRQQWEAAA